MTVTDTIKARDSTHGNYHEQSSLFVQLFTLIHTSPGWDMLTPEQITSLVMISTKISRIMSGDPNEVDHWHDIAGYATLVEKSITDPE